LGYNEKYRIKSSIGKIFKKMHAPQPHRFVRISVLLLFLYLIIWNFGAGINPLAAEQHIGTATASNWNARIERKPQEIQPAGQSTYIPTTSQIPQEPQVFDPTSAEPLFPSETSQATAASTPTTPPVISPILTGEFVPDVVLIKFESYLSMSGIDQCLKSAGATLESQIEKIDVLKVTVPTGKVAQAISSLSDCRGVAYVEPDYFVWMTDILPNDPGWGDQYGLRAIRAPKGWELDTGSAAVTIAIVDTGVDLGHVDLAGKIVPGYDFVNNDTVPQDDNYLSHGTHVAGIAAAITNNAVGVAGVSWGARIMPVKVLDAYGNGSYANVAAGIIWAAGNGAEVINLSLGGYYPSSVVKDAINYAYAKGVTLVAAAGNSGTNFVLYPARYPHVIAVAATDGSNKHAFFSNYGPEVDVSAPGVGIYSTTIGSSYGYLSGTSMSTAFVSGLASILIGLPAYMTPDQITSKLETSALDLGDTGKDDLYGFGLIQMDAAILSPWPTPGPTFISSFTPNLTLTFTATLTPTLTSTFTPTFTPTATFPATSTKAALILPATGFSPNRITILPVLPAVKGYADLADLWLEIPRLKVELPIVGVPQIENGWDVSWLGNKAGWLNGTAFPTHAGNSVLSAHVYDSSGKPGPFVHLNTLQWGDKIIVHAFGQEYVYAVREAMLVAPEAVASVIKHEEYPWLTLITCQGYDEASNSYRSRVVVRAVQVDIK
jgi:thermitase